MKYADPVIKKHIATIGKQYDLLFVVLFGSRARKQTHTASDLDIAVMVKQTPDEALFGKLFVAFSTLFPHETVDIRFLNNADPLFRFQVTKDGILLYGDEQQYTAYRLFAHKSYIDDGRKYFPFRDQLIAKKQQHLEAAL